MFYPHIYCLNAVAADYSKNKRLKNALFIDY